MSLFTNDNAALKKVAKAAEKIMETESKRLDELSRKTLKSYINKAGKSYDRLNKKGEAEEDKGMSTNGEKYPEKQERHVKAASKLYHKANNRMDGVLRASVRLAGKRMAKEEEAINELSDKTKKTYAVLAKANVKNRLGSSAAKRDGAKLQKRWDTAKKVSNEEVEQIDEISDKTKKTYAVMAKADVKRRMGSSAGRRNIDKLRKRWDTAQKVSESEQLDEKNFIKGAIKHPGAETRKAKAEGISKSAWEKEHEHDKGLSGKQARFGEVLRKIRNK